MGEALLSCFCFISSSSLLLLPAGSATGRPASEEGGDASRSCCCSLLFPQSTLYSPATSRAPPRMLPRRTVSPRKRYFIIIDDVWDIQTLKTLDSALLKNDCGSIIMTTTRIHDVAKSYCFSHGDLIYKIQPLGVTDSKKLFFKRIFGSEERCPPNLKEASKDILKRCGGLPLAINAISSLLAAGKTKEEWDRVRLSISFAQGNNSDMDAMNYILSLSYFDLPLNLRSCLLYLTMFPEDCKIEQERLVHRWIAEGFIHGKCGEDLVELGAAYFHELVNRSLIQPVDIGYDGKASYCRVHDTILDFLICKSIEENFCTLLGNHSRPDSRIRRLSLIGNEDQASVDQLDLSHARSLGAFGNTERLPSLVKSNALGVLDLGLEKCHGLESHHVRDLGRLLQLRYLRIRRSGIRELPREIGDLVYLETLDLPSDLVELPESVTRLKRLARLFVRGNTKWPDCIGSMEKLQELGYYIDILMQSVMFVEELGKLINLRKLCLVWGSSSTDSSEAGHKKKEMLVSSLCKLETCKLHTLSVMFSLREEDVGTVIAGHPFFFPALKSIRDVKLFKGYLRWITKWMLSVPNLETLSLWSWKHEVGQQEVDMVGRVPSLLAFSVAPDVEVEVEPVIIRSSCTSGGFQQLQMFEFSLSVRESLFEAGAMPNVRKLSLTIMLEEIKSASGGQDGFDDIGIQHLSSLAELRVSIVCTDVRAADVEAAEIAFKSMAEAHPNSPSLRMNRICVDVILKDNDER